MKKRANKNKKSKSRRIITYMLIIGVGSLIIAYGVVCRTIYSDVRTVCEKTTREFKGDIVEANIRFLQSDHHSFIEKNDVVWALGQIGDDRALSILEKLYTGTPCEKPCKKDNKICQYELEKAIKSCRGSFSLTRWMYRSFIIIRNTKTINRTEVLNEKTKTEEYNNIIYNNFFSATNISCLPV